MSSEDRFLVIKTYFQIQVKDLDRAKLWYESIFQLDTLLFASEVGWGEMQLHGGNPKLGLSLSNTPLKANWGKLMFEVDDIVKAKDYMKKKEIETTEIKTIPNMVSYFEIQDSEGNTIQIVAEPKE
jgi:predicted enzyme related to lactoylglutathione lyase